jgi:hypothetical protein
MQSKALERWADVEEKTSSSLLQENGLLFYGEDTGVTVEGSVLGAKEVMENLGLPHKFYATGNDIADAYPALPWQALQWVSYTYTFVVWLLFVFTSNSNTTTEFVKIPPDISVHQKPVMLWWKQLVITAKLNSTVRLSL